MKFKDEDFVRNDDRIGNYIEEKEQLMKFRIFIS